MNGDTPQRYHRNSSLTCTHSHVGAYIQKRRRAIKKSHLQGASETQWSRAPAEYRPAGWTSRPPHNQPLSLLTIRHWSTPDRTHKPGPPLCSLPPSAQPCWRSLQGGRSCSSRAAQETVTKLRISNAAAATAEAIAQTDAKTSKQAAAQAQAMAQLDAEKAVAAQLQTEAFSRIVPRQSAR